MKGLKDVMYFPLFICLYSIPLMRGKKKEFDERFDLFSSKGEFVL